MYIDQKLENSYLLKRCSSSIGEQKIIWLLYHICWLKFNELSCFSIREWENSDSYYMYFTTFFDLLKKQSPYKTHDQWMNLYLNIQFLIVRIMDHEAEWFFPHWTDGVLNGLHCTRWKKIITNNLFHKWKQNHWLNKYPYSHNI